ncbi:MAG: hypothetical protein ABIO85_08110 [Sphingomicrobium sp.]
MMNWQRPVARAVNRLLAARGLSLGRVSHDFDHRLADPVDLARLFDALAASLKQWFSAQTLIAAAPLQWRAEVEKFYHAYLASPYRAASGGSRFNNQLWLYAVTKAYAPSVVIDSGTYQGASAWALDLAVPGKVISFDIDMSQLVRREPGIQYIERDWFGADVLRGEDMTRALIYFDDHVNQARRLLEAQTAGLPLAIFDDDFPVGAFADMAHDGVALPKIEFLLDDAFMRSGRVRWYKGEQLMSFTASRDEIDRARRAIGRTERLPNTSLITGIHQTPYRIVEIAPV